MSLARYQVEKLQDARDVHRLNRETSELAQWLQIKQDVTADIYNTMDPELSKDTLDSNLESLKQEIKIKETKIRELIQITERLKQTNQSEGV